MKATFQIEVNGVRRRVEADPERSLLSLLRDDLELTGAKYGCGEGQCGACTVLLDGRAVRACLVRLPGADGKQVRTIEGLERDGRLHPLQEAFIAADALQCGYCTPGMIMAGVALLERNPDPAEAEIRGALEGNVCRCGAYSRIVDAVCRAARKGGER